MEVYAKQTDLQCFITIKYVMLVFQDIKISEVNVSIHQSTQTTSENKIFYVSSGKELIVFNACQEPIFLHERYVN